MNRRFFSKLLTMGAGSLGFWQAAAARDAHAHAGTLAAAPGDDTPRGEVAADAGRHREPARVADFQELARQALPRVTYEYITTGSMDEITLRENVAAFQRLRILPLFAGAA